MKNFVWESFFRLAVEKYSYLYVDYISRDISRGLCEFLCQYLIICVMRETVKFIGWKLLQKNFLEIDET